MPRTDLTPEQSTTLAWALVLLAERRKAGGTGLQVTTAQLADACGRSGQVLGLVCGNLARKGLLRRVAPATYKLTPAGFDCAEAGLAARRAGAP